MPAPKGNMFNRIWKTPHELESDINEYFDRCEKKGKPLTITGLALALGTNRQTLLNYENNLGENFDAIVKKAKLMCENFAEEYLYSGKNVTGAIFNLKNNYGWKDTHEQSISGKIENILSEEQINELLSRRTNKIDAGGEIQPN